MAGVIYVFVNEAMPGLIKIGKTDGRVEDRMMQLYAGVTGLPLQFECHFAAEVDNPDKAEITLHKLFAEHRVNPKREFFRVDPEKVVLAISMGTFKDVTPGEQPAESEEDKKAVEKAKSRRSNTNMHAIGVAVGAELVFYRDENKKALVVENNQVEFEGQRMSLSASALHILQSMGHKTTSVSGAGYWMYEDESLMERRQRLEQAQFGEQP